MKLARILVPLNYARNPRFSHDPAVPIPQLPVLSLCDEFAEAPKDAIFALGAANRILAIVPSKDLIMVRLGDFPKDSNFQSNIWLKF